MARLTYLRDSKDGTWNPHIANFSNWAIKFDLPICRLHILRIESIIQMPLEIDADRMRIETLIGAINTDFTH